MSLWLFSFSSIIFFLLIIYTYENQHIWNVLCLEDDSQFFLTIAEELTYGEIIDYLKQYSFYLTLIKLCGSDVILIRLINGISIIISHILVYLILKKSKIPKILINKFFIYSILNFTMFYVTLPIWRDAYIFLFLVIEYYIVFQLFYNNRTFKKIFYFLFFLIFLFFTQYLSYALLFAMLISIFFVLVITSKHKYIKIILSCFFLFIFLLYKDIYFSSFNYFILEKGFQVEAESYGFQKKLVDNLPLALIKAVVAPGLVYFFDNDRMYYRYVLDYVLLIGMLFYYFILIFKFPSILLALKCFYNTKMVSHLFVFLASFFYLFIYGIAYQGSVSIRKKFIFIFSLIIAYIVISSNKCKLNQKFYKILVIIIFLITLVSNIYQLLIFIK